MGAPLKVPSSLDRYSSIFTTAFFATVFFAAGSAIGYYLFLRPWLESRAAQAWVQTPCWVVSRGLKTHTGGNKATYSPEIVYTYQFNGQSYQSDQYDFTQGSSSDSTWAKAAIAQYRPRSAAVCYVNPLQPSQAVLSRDFDREWFCWVLPLVFSLVGLFIGGLAARSFRRRLKFGESDLEIEEAPAPLGGVLEGAIRLTRPSQFADAVELKLSCINRVVTGAGKSRNINEMVLWENTKHARLNPDNSIPVTFALPVDGVPTNSRSPQDKTFWRLRATAKVPGANYVAAFELPVAQEEITDREKSEANKIRADEYKAEENFQLPAHSRIRVESSSSGGKTFYFPAFRNPGMAIPMTLFLLVFLGAFWLLLSSKAPLIFPIFFGGIDLILLIIVAHEWFGTTRVVADGSGVTLTKHILGLGWTNKIPASDIKEIRTSVGATMNSGANSRVYYNVEIVRQNGMKVTAGDEVTDAHEAHWLALQMASCAGVGQ